MSGEGIEIEFETVTAKGRDVRLGEGLAQLMDQVVSQFLSAWAEGERWDELGRGLQGDPQPQVVSGLTGGGEEFVELEMSESQAVTEVSVQVLGMKPSSCQPQALSRLANAEDALQGVGRDAFGEQAEDEADDVRGRTEAIEGGVAPDREFVVAGLTAQIGNVVVAVEPVAHERMYA